MADGGIANIPAEERHLSEKAQAILGRSDEARRKYIQSDNFIPTPVTERIHQLMEDEFAAARSERQPGIIIEGAPCSGKSSIVKEFRDKYPRKSRPDAEHDDIPVVLFEIHTAKLGEFCDAFLGQGFDSKFEFKHDDAKQRHLITLLNTYQPKMVIIDEAHEINAGSISERRRLWSFIKHLMNTYKMTMVLAGTSELTTAISRQEQLNSRFVLRPKITDWDLEEKWSEFLFYVEADLPLKRASKLYEDERIMSFIWNYSNKRTGNAVMLLQRAAVAAIASGTERITLKLLKEKAVDLTFR